MSEIFKNLCLNSVEVAEKIRHIAASDFKLILNMTQTQKLLYISYGIELARTKTRLTDEHPRAWPFGPVFPNVHRKIDFSRIPTNPKGISEEIVTLLRDVIKAFGKTSASRLSEWSHSAGSPWDKAPKDKWGQALSDDDIFEYFSSLKCSKTDE